MFFLELAYKIVAIIGGIVGIWSGVRRLREGRKPR